MWGRGLLLGRRAGDAGAGARREVGLHRRVVEGVGGEGGGEGVWKRSGVDVGDGVEEDEAGEGDADDGGGAAGVEGSMGRGWEGCDDVATVPVTTDHS